MPTEEVAARAERIAEAERLKAAGHTYAEIARRLGVTPACVSKWLNPERTREWVRKQNARPERKAAKRRWDRERYRGVCAVCGVRTSRPDIDRCHRHQRAVQRRHERALFLERLWAEGLTHRQIAERLGKPQGYVQVEICQLRQQGYNFPRRPQGRFRHHRQEAA